MFPVALLLFSSTPEMKTKTYSTATLELKNTRPENKHTHAHVTHTARQHFHCCIEEFISISLDISTAKQVPASLKKRAQVEYKYAKLVTSTHKDAPGLQYCTKHYYHMSFQFHF